MSRIDYNKSKVLESTIKLFKGVYIGDYDRSVYIRQNIHKLLMDGLKNGILIDPKILISSGYDEGKKIVELAKKHYGINNIELNSTFYKAFSDVRSLRDLERFMHQLLHYASTYGSIESLRNSGDIWEPEHISKDINLLKEMRDNFTEIKLLNNIEITYNLNSTLSSNMALDSDEIKELIDIANYYNIDILADDISNKETMMHFHEINGTIPSDPVELLRYIVFIITEDTLLIKSKDVLKDVSELGIGKEQKNIILHAMYEFDIIKLSEIFNRFKPIFIAIKRNNDLKELRPLINKISKLSKKYHKPSKQNILLSITDSSKEVDNAEYKKALKNADTYHLVKIVGALKTKIYRYSGEKEYTDVYRIRNGKTYVINRDISHMSTRDLVKHIGNLPVRLSMAGNELLRRFHYKLKNKTIILPSGIDYGLPTSGKMMVSGLPNYTTLDVPKDTNLIIGITWDKRADIDLSASTIEGDNLGWFTSYGSRGVTYSGDMTSLNQHGVATEAFEVTKDAPSLIISENLFSGNELDYKFFIATPSMDARKLQGIKHIADVGEVHYVASLRSEYNSKSIGIYDSESSQFIFTSVGIQGINRQMVNHSSAKEILNGVMDIARMSPTLLSIVNRLVYDKEMEDIKLVRDKEDISNIDFNQDNILDLRLDSVTRDTFLDLMN